jgi:hypothetical protein
MLVAGPTESFFCAGCAMGDFLAEGDETLSPSNQAPVSAAGRKLVDGHELIEELARGGMGVVYRARQLSPRRDVALKMLLPAGERLEQFRERFRLEIRALTDLDHPSILPLYTMGEHEELPFFTMKLALGGSLAQRLKGKERLSFKEIARMISVLADAVFYANQRGVLHRDIKPGNILFDENGHPYLADFGLAKLVDGDSSNSMSMAALGTPYYMAPEVAVRGARAATASSDLYGLGAVLYELLAGKPPFHVEGMAAVLKKVAEEEPEAPSTLARGVPRDLEVICLSCLQKDPRRRYATAQALGQDLARWLAGMPIQARRVGPAERLAAWARRRPALAGMTVAFAATLVISSVWLTVQNSRLKSANILAERARRLADNQVDLVLGRLAPELEGLGRLPILEVTWQSLDETYQTDPLLLESPEGKLQRAKLLSKWAASRLSSGQVEPSFEKSKEAEAIARDVLTKDLNSVPAQGALADALLGQAKARAAAGDTEEALALLDAIAKLPVARQPEFLAESEQEKAAIYASAGSSAALGAEALPAARAALAAARAWLAAEPQSIQAQVSVVASLLLGCKAQLQVAGLADRQEPYPKDKSDVVESCLRDCHEALSIAEPRRQTHASMQKLRLQAKHTIAYLRRRGPEDPATLLAEDAALLGELEALCTADPANTTWRYSHCAACGDAALLLGRLNRTADELVLRRRAVELATALLAATPGTRLHAIMLMRNELALADCLERSGDSAGAEAALLRCLRGPEECFNLKQGKTPPSELEGYRQTVDLVRKRLQRPAAVSQHLAACSRFLEAKAAADSYPGWAALAADVWRDVADQAKAEGRWEQCCVANENALRHRLGLLRAGHEREAFTGKVWNAYQKTAESQIGLKNVVAALKTAREAAQSWRELAPLPGERAPWAYAGLLACKAASQDPAATEEIRQAASHAAAEISSVLYGEKPPETDNDKTVHQRLAAFQQSPRL